eukprot:TCALIF_10569-PA protein Name:"Similar to gag-pol Gag-Pol polyprotein (Walleye dermal sarcoma virus)" AED:0.25 eAED:0.27 QI:80/0/0/1/0/0/8/0/1134
MTVYPLEVQPAYFRGCLATDTLNLLDQFLDIEDDMSVEEVLNKLEKHFRDSVSLFRRRFDFYSCSQKHGEPFSDFFVRLKFLGSVAELNNINYEDQLATRIVLAIQGQDLQRELLQLETPALDEIKKKCLAYEVGGINQRALLMDTQIQGLSTRRSKVHSNPKIVRDRSKSQTRKASNNNQKCARCNYYPHTNPQHCPALILLPDTGATEAIVPANLVKKFKITIDRSRKRKILASNGTNPKCHGVVDLQIKWLKHKAQITAFVSPDVVGVFLAWHNLIALRMIPWCFPYSEKDALRLGVVPTKKAPQPKTVTFGSAVDLGPEMGEEDLRRFLMEEFQDVFDSSSSFKVIKGDPIKIHLKPSKDTKPLHVTTTRPIPYHFREETEKELAYMDRMGITEDADEPTPWVSPFLVLGKPGGGVRLVVDYSALNRHVERPVHPFPSVSEIMISIPSTAKWTSAAERQRKDHHIEVKNHYDKRSRTLSQLEKGVTCRLQSPRSKLWHREVEIERMRTNGRSYMTNLDNEDGILENLQRYYCSQRSVVLDCVNFHQRKQDQSETFDQFRFAITDLAEDAVLCTTCVESQIVTQIIIGTKDEKARHMLEERKFPSLGRTIEICQTNEVASGNQASLTNSSVYKISTYQQGKKKGGERDRNQPRDQNQAQGKNQWPSNKSEGNCWYCGQDRHSRKECPAKNQTCSFCHKQGHIQVACKSKKYGRQSDKQGSREEKPKNQGRISSVFCGRVCAKGEPFCDLATISIKFTDQLNKAHLETTSRVLPDTGAGANLMSKSTFDTYGLENDSLADPILGEIRRVGMADAEYQAFLDHLKNNYRRVDQSISTYSKMIPELSIEPLKRDPHPIRPFEEMAANFFSIGNNHFMAIVDRYSGWLEMVHFPRPPTSTSTVANLRKIFTALGCPTRFFSDGGLPFTAKETQDFFYPLGEYPQSNGLAESGVEVLKKLLLKCGGIVNEAFCEGLLELRNTPRPGGKSPAEIVYGHPLRSRVPAHHRSFDPKWVKPMDECDNKTTQIQLQTTKRYNVSSRVLMPIQIGLTANIQNQQSKLWDHSGRCIWRNHPWRNRRHLRLLTNENPEHKKVEVSSPEQSPDNYGTTNHESQQVRRSRRVRYKPRQRGGNSCCD